MIKIIKNYTKIFRGMRLPWLLLFLLVVISAIQANVEVGAITLTASIIDGTQKAIKTDELIQYIELQLLSGIITIAFHLHLRPGAAEAESSGKTAGVEQDDESAHQLLRFRQCQRTGNPCDLRRGQRGKLFSVDHLDVYRGLLGDCGLPAAFPFSASDGHGPAPDYTAYHRHLRFLQCGSLPCRFQDPDDSGGFHGDIWRSMCGDFG